MAEFVETFPHERNVSINPSSMCIVNAMAADGLVTWARASAAMVLTTILLFQPQKG